MFYGATPVKKNDTIRAGFKGRRPQPEQCFYNAQMFVLNDETEYTAYYEGYVTSGVRGVLIHHAWLVAGGVVYDPTLEAAGRALKASRAHAH